MPLTQQLKNLVKQELILDPYNIGYRYFIDLYKITSNPNYISNIHSILCDSVIKKTKKILSPMHDLFTFLSWAPLQNNLPNVQIIWTLLSRVPYDVVPSVVSSINELPARDLLKFLNGYGAATMLYMFGNPEYTQDELMLFEQVVRELLEFLVENDSLVQEEVLIFEGSYEVPRICNIFKEIENAPNTITENDILQIVAEI